MTILEKCNAIKTDKDTNLLSTNLKRGVTVLGVTGTYEGETDANLIPENIKKGVTIFGVTGTYEGETTTAETTDDSTESATTES